MLVEGFQTKFVITQLVWVVAAVVVLLLAAVFFPSALVPLLLGFLGLLTVVFLVMSHRIAGPLHRFQQVFREVAHGRLTTTVQLRDRDYLKPEAADLDAMIASLRERIGRAQTAARQCRGRAGQLLDRPASTTNPDLRALSKELAQLCATLDVFQVEPSGHPSAWATRAEVKTAEEYAR
jgi:methyl-accepting chemotaxis protein